MIEVLPAPVEQTLDDGPRRVASTITHARLVSAKRFAATLANTHHKTVSILVVTDVTTGTVGSGHTFAHPLIALHRADRSR